ncbi:imidazole glycerol phosphate synthase subunit HisH [Maricaulaceae bacterium EIL42A08]|nr:imidazole glycerol phosphate synthase subunit HisH [Maricaulaceae bacterium EIL42A08]
MTTAIIDTSTANIASVRYALERLDAPHFLASTPDEAVSAERLILPGVGAAGPAMAALRANGWAEALQNEARPLLGVCLGMQMLFEWSEESDCALLGLIPGKVQRLDPGEAGPWPHMGWNTLTDFAVDEPLLAGLNEGERVYFVHGFFIAPGANTVAQTRYGAQITAMARNGNVAGCQFHPERSGSVGARILKNFVEPAA